MRADKSNPKMIQILLVDDNEDDVLMFKDILEGAKLINTLEVVYDGQEAMAYLRKEGNFKDSQTPGLIMLDITMPKKNGFEVLEEIKTDLHLKHIPVIVFTTSSREEDIFKSYSFGAASYISKPVEIKKFQEVINHFLIYWAMVAEIPGMKE
jgi:CheY-like chemotaxis protein